MKSGKEGRQLLHAQLLHTWCKVVSLYSLFKALLILNHWFYVNALFATLQVETALRKWSALYRTPMPLNEFKELKAIPCHVENIH